MDQNPAPAESRFAAEAQERTSHDGFSPIPVVGLGGSAGAIPALGRFLEGVTVPSGLVYVVILHLSADHESTLAELLQRHTTMPVVQARAMVSSRFRRNGNSGTARVLPGSGPECPRP